jgi:hypothetical protein
MKKARRKSSPRSANAVDRYIGARMREQIVLHFGRGRFVLGVDVQNIPIHLVKARARNEPSAAGQEEVERLFSANFKNMKRA